MWGAAYGLAAHAGLDGRKAFEAVFGTVYPGDVLLSTALSIYRPTTWTAEDWAIDLGERLVGERWK